MINKTEFDRELVGPDSYEYFNDLSKFCQNKYLGFHKWQLLLLLVIAIISTVPIFPEAIEKGKLFIELALIISVLILMIIQFRTNYMDGWQKSRFLAESILSTAWLVVFKIDKYNCDWSDALKSFHEKIKEIKNEIKLDEYLKYVQHKSSDNDSPDWMKEAFDLDYKERVEFYIKHRLNHQEGYYFKKTKYNTKKGELFFWLALISMGLGAVLTILIITKTLPNYSYLGLFTTLSATLFSWKQTKRFDELSSTYSVAIEELKDFKKKLLIESSDTGYQTIVYDCERSISREHKLWVSRIQE